MVMRRGTRIEHCMTGKRGTAIYINDNGTVIVTWDHGGVGMTLKANLQKILKEPLNERSN
jgi:hypothetical protein